MKTKRITPKDLGISPEMPVPKKKDWRIGVIGFGGIARGCHAVAYRDAGWTIAAVADPDPAARANASKQFGVTKLYEDYHDLIADDSVEIVDLLTHPDIREEVVLAACEAKKHIITEKPFAMNEDECKRMIDAAEKAGIQLAVHQNYRWIGPNWFAKKLIDAGIVGEPFMASIEIFGRQDEEIADHPFFSTCEDFLTIQWDNHLADLFRFWTGRDAERVFAVTGRMKGQNFRSDNLLLVMADFGKHLKCHMLHHELVRGAKSCAHARIDGNKGTLTFDPFKGQVSIQSSELGEGVHVLDAKGYDFTHSFAGTMGDFLAAIEDGRAPMTSGRDNLTTIRTILAEAESTRAGGAWIRVG
jgi:predicted dehydrogenase